MTPLRLTPAANVFLAGLSPDLVLLDTTTDAYFCLVDANELITPASGGGFDAASEAVRDDLLETGLFVTGAPPRPLVAMPTRPLRTTRSTDSYRGTWRDRRDFALAIFYTARRFNGRSVRDLVEHAARDRPSITEPDRLLKRARLFDNWLPWIPGQGQCLYRAFALLDFLRRDGLSAQWVFGVRTWPFSAHCWLQCEDLLLDDDLDRVALYTPIMAV